MCEPTSPPAFGGCGEHSAVRTLAIVIFTFNITFGAAWSVLVLYATERPGIGNVGFGLLTTASAVGGLVTTVMYDRLERRFALTTMMRFCLSCEVFVHLALALATEPWMALAVMFGFGAYAHVWGTVASTLRQRAVPADFQGRVSGVYFVALFGGIVLGSAIGAVIAEIGGVTAPFWFAFVATAVILVAVWRQLPHVAHAGEVAAH